MKRYMLTSPAFVAATLLVEGSIITQADLGKKTVPVLGKDGKPTGKTKEVDVRPPSDAIEVDAKGNPVNAADEDLLAGLSTEKTAIAAVQPHAPNPTEPQGAPSQAAGGVQVAENALPTEPEAAPASVDVAAKAEAPKRRGDSK